MKPSKIHRQSGSDIEILWDDGHHGLHTLKGLRDSCPCASCKSEREDQQGTIVLPILVHGKFDLKGITPVGAYAISLQWADGHRTGIYAFDYLRGLCECGECAHRRAGHIE